MSREDALERLRGVIDPELGIDIVELGLIYDIVVDQGAIVVTMTLTTPGCPLHDSIVGGVERALEESGEPQVDVRLVWDPPWTPERIGESGLEQLGSPAST
jgi:metal-sulfur cluster biosynthetic enzyme